MATHHLTLTDAKSEPIVRRALESALVSGVAQPMVEFGSPASVTAWLDSRGTWSVWQAPGVTDLRLDLTTDDAVARIVSTARSI